MAGPVVRDIDIRRLSTTPSGPTAARGAIHNRYRGEAGACKLTGPSCYSNAKMRFQSFFMLITVQDRVFASSISD